jgi:hypothetical protein
MKHIKDQKKPQEKGEETQQTKGQRKVERT